MTITEYAKSKGCTRQAVFYRYSKRGYKTHELTDKSGQLTTVGISLLDQLYKDSEEKQDKKPKENENKAEADNQIIIDQLKKELENTKVDRDNWRDISARYADRIQEMEQRTDKLTDMVMQLTQNLKDALMVTAINPEKLETGEAENTDARSKEKQHGKIYYFFHPSEREGSGQK